jgi:hypothetical protein
MRLTNKSQDRGDPGNPEAMPDALDPNERRRDGLQRLLASHGVPTPDEIYPRDDGELVCIWHEPRVALVIAEDEAGAAAVSPQATR